MSGAILNLLLQLMGGVIGGVAAGLITDYIEYRRSHSPSLRYWLAYFWDDALFYAVCGSLIASRSCLCADGRFASLLIEGM